MNSTYGLVLNLGLKSIRAIVFSVEGRKLATSSRPIHTYLRDTWIEQDPQEWWVKGIQCVHEALDQLGNREVAFITVSASAACLVPVDAAGVALRRAIMVSDRRSAEVAEKLADLPSFRALQALNPTFVADAYFLAPKAVWIREHEPDVFERTRWLMTPADFLVHRLTGVAVTDPLNAEKFFFDLDASTYPSTFLSDAGLDVATLPPVANIGECIGQLTPSAANALGLTPKTSVILSTYDAICAFWGSGVREHGDVADVSGTVTSVRALSAEPIQSEGERRVFSQYMPSAGMYMIGGSNNLGGGLIEWLKQSFYAADHAPYAAMEEEAEASGPAARGLLFLPYLLGERCPIWDPNARGVFFGLERQHHRGDFARAVFESAAFSVAHILQAIAESKVRPKRLRVSGGLARLRLISAIKSDLTGLETEVLAEFETTALGAFMIAATGAGFFTSLREAAQLARVREVIIPDKARGEGYAEWFALYLRLYDSLRDLFAERQSLFVRHRLGGVERLENL